jgi:hypothetical protein
MLIPVRYTADRLIPLVDVIESGTPAAQKEMRKVLSTKYEHWRYESELRVFARLKDRDAITGHCFEDFSSKMVLREVIVGPSSTATRADIDAALGTLARKVEVRKARLAFKTYSVIRQRDPNMWK